jgi:hypothetical protein
MSRRLRILLAVFFFLLLAGLALRIGLKQRQPAADAADPNGLVSQKLVDQFLSLDAGETELNRTLWAKEILAEECGQVFDSLWDSLNGATNKLDVVASFPLDEITMGVFRSSQSVAHGIELRESSGPGPTWSAPEWRRFVRDLGAAGWQLDRVEFRHNQFETDAAGQPSRSRFYFSGHLTQAAIPQRAVIEGDLIVHWAARGPADKPAVKRIDASRLTLKTRRGAPPFRAIFTEQITPPEKSFFIDPLILYDLDGDGLSEIILGAKNLVFHRMPDGRFESAPLCRHSPGLIFTGAIADFDGDGAADFLCAQFEGLSLFKGSPRGAFDEPGQSVWSVNPHLKYAQALTCGDIDGDGDLDVFLAQYKLPYDRGQMPTPYFDANDGNPSYLLLNDGHGHFSDATEAAGLGAKRWRRTYSASFADLDGDGHLDLVVVSDFAGVDLYRNDGHGHFTDVTRDWVREPRAFGMAHTLADFDGDGRLDLLMIGMNSPTASRLDHLGLVQPGAAGDRGTRAAMTFGNRLYLGRPEGGFRQTSLNDSLARTGWSWGCAAADFDSDGFPDLGIANGHETKQSVRDYEPEFWLHDLHIANSKESVVANAYFQSKFGRTRGRGWSYGGYEKNRFFLNQGGQAFVEAAHLLGLALEEDSRSMVADDLDGDGRVDLLVTTFEAWPQSRQTLRLFRNEFADGGNWIGFRFREEGNGTSPIGAQVTVSCAGRRAVCQIITGDSFRSQHAATTCFGLGNSTEVDSVEVRWIGGRKLVLRQPAINQYHRVSSQAALPSQ